MTDLVWQKKTEWRDGSYSKWREMIRGNWNDGNSDSDAVWAEYELYVSGAGLPRANYMSLFVCRRC